ncbi:hypothetical protein ACFOJ6_17385 [Gordonia humi]|uniref:hypothetical protein n=1 Tax=Gordonia humi TaxID=686429 RepID=UPI00360AB0BF
MTEIVTAPSSTTPQAPSSTEKSSNAERRLTASFDDLALAQPVGLAVEAVGGGNSMVFGDQTPRVAWSTIKVPIALAAERRNGASDSESAAIIDSDNAAAEALWASLGSPDQAAAAVTEVLREGGDETTTVPSQKLRPEYTVFGQTSWPLADAATFTAHLPCLPGSEHVVSLMGQVARQSAVGPRGDSGARHGGQRRLGAQRRRRLRRPADRPGDVEERSAGGGRNEYVRARRVDGFGYRGTESGRRLGGPPPRVSPGRSLRITVRPRPDCG